MATLKEELFYYYDNLAVDNNNKLYFYKNNNNYKDNFCIKCNIEKTLFIEEAAYICTKCGQSTYTLITNDIAFSNGVTFHTRKYAPYKRNIHLKEKINRFQAKESLNIPDYKLIKIRREIERLQLENDEMKIEDMKKILKNLKMNRYYKHVVNLMFIICNIHPPILTRAHEQLIKDMFEKVLLSYQKLYTIKRTNFISYNYVINKILALIGLKEYQKFFSLLKCKKKLITHDKIWSAICKDNSWKFESSFKN